MKLRFLFIVFLPSLTLAQKGIIESCSITSPVVVDGNFDEWQAEWMMDTKGKFLYNICNDADNLYLRLRVSDELTQRKIGLFGLSIFLNPKGKKVGKIGFRYPMAKDLDELKKQTPDRQLSKAEVQAMKMGLIKDAEVLELLGFSKEPIVSPRLGLMNGLLVFIKGDDKGAFAYEAKIPFKAFRIDRSKVKVLGVAFVTGKMPPPKANNNNSSPPPGGGPGNYGYSGNYGMRGYGQGPRSSQPVFSEWSISTYMAVGVKLK